MMVETTDNDRWCGHAASPMTYVQLSRASRGDDVFARRVHSEKRIASVWRLSVCPSVCLFFSSFSFLIRLLQHNAPSDSPGAVPADNAARVRFGPCVIGVTLVSRTVVPPDCYGAMERLGVRSSLSEIHTERNCADTIGAVPVPWAGHFQCYNINFFFK